MKKDPSRVSLHIRVAQLFEFKGSKKDALRHYEQYLAVVPRGHSADDARVKIQQLSRVH